MSNFALVTACKVTHRQGPLLCLDLFFSESFPLMFPPQWGAADAEIKVPSDENTETKGSPFKAWSRSAYCYACCAYCQGFLPC